MNEDERKAYERMADAKVDEFIRKLEEPELKPRSAGPSLSNVLEQLALKKALEHINKPVILVVREEDHIKVHALGWGTGVQGHADKLAALKAAQVLIAEQLQLATAALLNDGCDELEATAPAPARNRPPEKKL